jgi:hypothetical protein
MCTTSAECKTVIIAVLMVMNGMDPHIISWNLRWVWLVLSKWVSLGCGSVTVRLHDAIEFVIFEEMSTLLVYCINYGIGYHHYFLQVKPKSQAIHVDSLHVIFSPTCWLATISLLKLAFIVALGRTKRGSPTKSTNRSQKIHTRPASFPVVPVEDAPMLRFPRHSVIFLLDPRVIL